MKCTHKHAYLFSDEGVEAECEGDDEEDDDDGELEEGDGDVGEHDDVDAEEGQLAHVGQQVQPREQEAAQGGGQFNRGHQAQKLR